MDKVAERFMYLWSLRVPLRHRFLTEWYKHPLQIMYENFDFVHAFYEEDATFRQCIYYVCHPCHPCHSWQQLELFNQRKFPQDEAGYEDIVYRLLLEHYAFDIL